MVRGAPVSLTCFLVGFCTDFVTSVRGLAFSDGVLAFGPRGSENPKGAPPVRPPLTTSLCVLVNICGIVLNAYLLEFHGSHLKLMYGLWRWKKIIGKWCLLNAQDFETLPTCSGICLHKLKEMIYE